MPAKKKPIEEWTIQEAIEAAFETCYQPQDPAEYLYALSRDTQLQVFHSHVHASEVEARLDPALSEAWTQFRNDWDALQKIEQGEPAPFAIRTISIFAECLQSQYRADSFSERKQYLDAMKKAVDSELLYIKLFRDQASKLVAVEPRENRVGPGAPAYEGLWRFCVCMLIEGVSKTATWRLAWVFNLTRQSSSQFLNWLAARLKAAPVEPCPANKKHFTYEGDVPVSFH
jgi:hypothetical protein